MSQSPKLSAPGWPRPRRPVDDLPIPWVSPEDQLGNMNQQRHTKAIMETLCQVCGEGWKSRHEKAWACADGGPLDAAEGVPNSGWAPIIDETLMHPRCGKLAIRRCPHLRARDDALVLFVFEFPVGAAQVHTGLMKPYVRVPLVEVTKMHGQAAERIGQAAAKQAADAEPPKPREWLNPEFFSPEVIEQLDAGRAEAELEEAIAPVDDRED